MRGRSTGRSSSLPLPVARGKRRGERWRRVSSSSSSSGLPPPSLGSWSSEGKGLASPEAATTSREEEDPRQSSTSEEEREDEEDEEEEKEEDGEDEAEEDKMSSRPIARLQRLFTTFFFSSVKGRRGTREEEEEEESLAVLSVSVLDSLSSASRPCWAWSELGERSSKPGDLQRHSPERVVLQVEDETSVTRSPREGGKHGPGRESSLPRPEMSSSFSFSAS